MNHQDTMDRAARLAEAYVEDLRLNGKGRQKRRERQADFVSKCLYEWFTWCDDRGADPFLTGNDTMGDFIMTAPRLVAAEALEWTVWANNQA